MILHHNHKEIIGTGFRFDLGRSIRTRRLLLKLTQGEAAKRTNGEINEWTWCKFERGLHEPKVYQFAAILQALGLSEKPWQQLINDLMTGSKHGGRNESGTKRRQRCSAGADGNDRGQDGRRQDCGEVDETWII